MEQKNFRGFLIFIFIFLLMVGYQLEAGTHFNNNLMVEIIGVSFELLITLFILEYWQKKREKEKLITLERRLREYLIFFLKHNFKTLPKNIRIGRFYGENHDENITTLSHIKEHLKMSGLTSIEEASIKQHCIRELSTLSNLLPVASELTNGHFKSWCRIVHFVNCIAQDIDPINQCTIDIIQNIIKFDTSSYDNGLYVGAKEME
jgi:hypothetical protein